jgi:hypothetical protein
MRTGGEKSFTPGHFVATHCLWKYSRGCLYVGEVLKGQRIQKFAPKAPAFHEVFRRLPEE